MLSSGSFKPMLIKYILCVWEFDFRRCLWIQRLYWGLKVPSQDTPLVGFINQVPECFLHLPDAARNVVSWHNNKNEDGALKLYPSFKCPLK